MNRRGFLGAIIAACAAPAVIKTAGLIMPIKPALVPSEDAVLTLLTRRIRECEEQTYRDFTASIFGAGSQPDIAIAGDTFMRGLSDLVDYPNPPNVGDIDRTKHSWWKNRNDTTDAMAYAWREVSAGVTIETPKLAPVAALVGAAIAIGAAGQIAQAAEAPISRRNLLRFGRGE